MTKYRKNDLSAPLEVGTEQTIVPLHEVTQAI